MRPVRAVGTVRHDETRLTIVTMRSDGYIEELFVNKTGQHVHAGEPLFRVYSPDIVSAQVDLWWPWARPSAERRRAADAIAISRVPCSAAQSRGAGGRIREPRGPAANPRTIDWPAPATGDVIEKRVINGQRVNAGRRALPDRRPHPCLGDCRCRRSGPARHQDRHPRHASWFAPTWQSRSRAKSPSSIPSCRPRPGRRACASRCRTRTGA